MPLHLTLRRRRSQRHPQTPSLSIRPLTRDDVHALITVFAGLSDKSRYQRFHTGLPALPEAMVGQLLDLHDGRHVGFVAEFAGEPVGIVRWLRSANSAPPDRTGDGSDSEVAEVAIEVVDRLHGRGVGHALIDRALQSATEAGIRELTFYVGYDNHRMRQWLREAGATPRHDDPLELRLRLSPSEQLPSSHTTRAA